MRPEAQAGGPFCLLLYTLQSLKDILSNEMHLLLLALRDPAHMEQSANCP